MECGSYKSPGGDFFDNYIEASMHLDHFGMAVRAGYDTILAGDMMRKQLLELRAKLSSEAADGVKTSPLDEHVVRFAATEAANGYQFMQQVILVRVASVLESGVEAMLRHVTAYRAHINAPTATETRNRSRMRRERATPIKRYDARLSAIGLRGTIESIIDDNVKHLIEVRNVIVHRDGVADERLLQAAPANAYELNTSVQLDGETLHRFITAVRWYLFDLVVRWDALYRELNPAAEHSDVTELIAFRDQLLSHLKELAAEKETRLTT